MDISVTKKIAGSPYSIIKFEEDFRTAKMFLSFESNENTLQQSCHTVQASFQSFPFINFAIVSSSTCIVCRSLLTGIINLTTISTMLFI